MPDARYFVFKQHREWLVVLDGRVMARQTGKQRALQSAIGMANLMGAMQYDADVMLDDGKGPLQQIWSRPAGGPGRATVRRVAERPAPAPQVEEDGPSAAY